jgi:hypothetical protein
LAPDFKTIADFRRDNIAAIVSACRALCCFAGIRDYLRRGWWRGSKFRAAASAKRIIGRREIAQEAAHLLKPAAACTIIAASFSCQSFKWNFARWRAVTHGIHDGGGGHGSCFKFKDRQN